MERSMVNISLLVIILLSILYIIPLQTIHVYSKPEYRVLLIHIPGISINYFNETYSPLYGKWNNTLVVKIDSEPPYTLLYHELLLINTSWNLVDKLVLKDHVIVNNEAIEPYKVIDYKYINNTWGFLSTVFINTRSVDPGIHNRTINPYYNYTYRYFPPQLITLEINGTKVWNLLNTTINVSYINKTFRITIEGYRRDVVFKNTTLDTEPMLINVTLMNLTVHPGLYNIKFRIIDYNETHVTIFTPGTLEQYNWLSKFYGIYTKPVVPSLPIEYFKYLGIDDIEWVFNETINFYMDIASYAFRYRDASLYVFTIPLYEEIYNAMTHNYISVELAYNLTKYLINFVRNLVDTAKNRLGDTYIAIYVPYVFMNKTVRDISIPELTLIVPGLYRINSSLVNVLNNLFENGIDFNIIKHGNEYYVLIKYRNYTVNNIGLFNNGYFIMYPGESFSETVVVNQRTIIGYITAFARGYGIGFTNINDIIKNLNNEIKNLRDQISNMNRTIYSLNNTLINTQLDLGKCRSDYLNISGLVRDLRNEIEIIKSREMKWMLYALTGTASIFAILIVMYLIGTRGLKKK